MWNKSSDCIISIFCRYVIFFWFYCPNVCDVREHNAYYVVSWMYSQWKEFNDVGQYSFSNGTLPFNAISKFLEHFRSENLFNPHWQLSTTVCFVRKTIYVSLLEDNGNPYIFLVYCIQKECVGMLLRTTRCRSLWHKRRQKKKNNLWEEILNGSAVSGRVAKSECCICCITRGCDCCEDYC